MAHPLNCISNPSSPLIQFRHSSTLALPIQAMCSIAARIIRQNEELYVAGAFLKNAALDNTGSILFLYQPLHDADSAIFPFSFCTTSATNPGIRPHQITHIFPNVTFVHSVLPNKYALPLNACLLSWKILKYFSLSWSPYIWSVDHFIIWALNIFIA